MPWARANARMPINGLEGCFAVRPLRFGARLVLWGPKSPHAIIILLSILYHDEPLDSGEEGQQGAPERAESLSAVIAYRIIISLHLWNTVVSTNCT